MKRIISFALMLTMLLCIATEAYAVPSNVQYRSTRRFLELLDEDDISYTLSGLDSDDDEVVKLTADFDAGNSATFTMYFSSDNEHCSLRVWNLIDFDSKSLNQMFIVCNTLNTTYKYCTFYVDTTDNSITVSMDLIFRSTGSDEICEEAVLRCYNICNGAMDTLKDYMK